MPLMGLLWGCGLVLDNSAVLLFLLMWQPFLDSPGTLVLSLGISWLWSDRGPWEPGYC